MAILIANELWFEFSSTSTPILVSPTRPWLSSLSLNFGFSSQAGPPRCWYLQQGHGYPFEYQSSGRSTPILVSPTRPWLSSLVSVLRQVHPDTGISHKSHGHPFWFQSSGRSTLILLSYMVSSLVPVLRWVHPNTGISNKAMAILFGFSPQAGPP